jgi:hypothetical protein
MTLAHPDSLQSGLVVRQAGSRSETYGVGLRPGTHRTLAAERLHVFTEEESLHRPGPAASRAKDVILQQLGETGRAP